MIRAGRVTLNGQPTRPGNRVAEGDEVRIDGEPLRSKPDPLYIAFNKPVGIVCTTDSKEPRNIIRYIGHPQRLFPIGRLDKPSEGLIFLTNDGDIVNKILRAGNQHEKEYQVAVKQKITPEFVRRMSEGVPILDTVTQPCPVKQAGPHTFTIILTQGLNRQIRRMCDYLGYEVTHLRRTRIMNVRLGNLKTGAWRPLSKEEVRQILEMVAQSSKTEEASRDGRKRRRPSANRKRKL